MSEIQIYKNTKAERVAKRLESMEIKRNRYRVNSSVLDELIDVGIGSGFWLAVAAVIVSITDYWFSIPQALMWSIYGGIFVGIPILVGTAVGVKRGVSNLYERTVLYLHKKRVNKFRANGTIFSLDPSLVNRWEEAIERVGGNPRDASASPQEHWAVFEHLNYLDQLRESSLTSQVRKNQLEVAITTVIEDEVLDFVAGQRLTQQQLASIETKERAKREKAERERIKTERKVHDQEIVTALEMVGLRQVDPSSEIPSGT